jgi:hypothetical protein
VPRWLDALTREEPVDGLLVDAQDPPDANSVEPSVVNQSPDRLRMNTKPARHFSDAVQRLGL